MYAIIILSVFVILLGFTCLIQTGQRNYWRDRSNKYKKAYNAIAGEFNSLFVSNFHTFIEKFFEDTEIQNHSIQVSHDKIDVKIGNEEVMVKVDSDLLAIDVIEALEKAQKDWKKARK